MDRRTHCKPSTRSATPWPPASEMLPRFIPLANRFGDRFFIEVLPTLSKTASDHLDQAWHRASRDSDQAAVDSSNTAQMGTRMSLLDGMLVSKPRWTGHETDDQEHSRARCRNHQPFL